MAKELQCLFTPNKTVYAVIFNSTGSVWQTTTSTFVTYVSANLANYKIALAAAGTAATSPFYQGDFPSAIATAGAYGFALFSQVGGSPAESDTQVGGGVLDWDGTAPSYLSTRAPASTALSTATWTGTIAGRIDAAITTRQATFTASTGVTLPATVASPTNITAGTITTVTNLTNAPTSGDFTTTMKTSIGTAVAASAVASVTGDVGGNVVGSVGSVLGAVTVGTNNDKTGYTLTQAFPSNFATLGINASGHIDRVTLTDTLTTYTSNTPQTGDAFARIGNTGSGLTSLAPSATALSTTTWTGPRAAALDNLDATVSSRASAANLATVAGYLDTEIAAILEDTGTTLPAQIAALNNLSAGDVETVVDASIAAVGLTTTVTGRIDAAVSSRMATYVQPVGFLTATFPAGTIANNTTAPTWYTAPSANVNVVQWAGTDVPTPGNPGVPVVDTTYWIGMDPPSLTIDGRLPVQVVSMSDNVVTAAAIAPAAIGASEAPLLANLDAAISTRLASSSYTAPANSDVAAIKIKTDALPSDVVTAVAAQITSDHGVGSYVGSGGGGADFHTAILTVDPNNRLVDSAGNPVTSVSVAQALAALFVNMLGDRGGVGSRTVTASVPGVANCSVSAERVSRSVIQATITLPAG